MTNALSENHALDQLDKLKKRYDILKWIAGIAVGLLTGAFFAGAYYAQVKSFLSENTLPTNMIAYFNLPDCPKGWSRADIMRGRYAVGRDTAGKDNLGKQVGIALEDLENRATGAHTHPYIDAQVAYNAGGGGISQGKGEPWGIIKPTSETDMPKGAKDGTNAPYTLLSACAKD